MATDSEYLRFEQDTEWKGKTQVWLVIPKSRDEILGRIRWFRRWRQYAFFPEPGTVWNTGCLDDVQTCIKRLMAEWRAARR